MVRIQCFRFTCILCGSRSTANRYKVLKGRVAERVRDIVREECQKVGVEILRGHVSTNHVHVLVSIPPQVTISRLIQKRKGKSSYRLFAEFSHLRKRYWGGHLWARGYFCRSSGNVTDEVIKAYIEDQSPDHDEVFRVEGEDSSPEEPPST